jgi:hypothetical protein
MHDAVYGVAYQNGSARGSSLDPLSNPGEQKETLTSPNKGQGTRNLFVTPPLRKPCGTPCVI